MDFNFVLRTDEFPASGIYLPPPLASKVQSLLKRREPGKVEEIIFCEPPSYPTPDNRERITALIKAVEEGADIAFGLLNPPTDNEGEHHIAVVLNPQKEPYYWGLNNGGAVIRELLRDLSEGLKIRKARLAYRAIWGKTQQQ